MGYPIGGLKYCMDKADLSTSRGNTILMNVMDWYFLRHRYDGYWEASKRRGELI